MEIKKEDKIFSVRENKRSWTVTRKVGKTTLSYSVPKECCPTFESLEAFVNEQTLF